MKRAVMFSTWPYLTERPSVTLQRALAQTTNSDEYNRTADMLAVIEELEITADRRVALEKQWDTEREALEERVSELKSDIELLNEEHNQYLDDMKSESLTASKILRVVERAFAEIELKLPIDPDDWDHITIMEAFASRMAALERT